MSEWESGHLGDFLTLKRGYDLRLDERDSNGSVPIYSSSGIMTLFLRKISGFLLDNANRAGF
jgi:hypothetical protein